MPLDSQKVSRPIPEEILGSLGSCLVEGDPEQRRRERRVRRRSLVVSILVQAAVIALLALLPLLGKSERIALAIPRPFPLMDILRIARRQPPEAEQGTLTFLVPS